nr:hypothetical protein [Tanacetum cinerariifolium]
MVAYLNKSDASEGFTQVINFLNGSYIKYALTVNLTIYVSCIKQFWNTVVVKQSNDVTRLQALVDRKKVVITGAVIRHVLRLDDADGVDCLPNEEIFAELARMGYWKPSTKLTFYKAFFSSQWKVETPLFEGMLVAGEIEEQGDAEEQVQDNVDDVAQGADTTVSGDDVQDQSIPSPTPPPQQPQDLPSTSQEALDACAALTRRFEHLEHDKVAQDLEIIKLKKRVKKLEWVNKVKVLKLMRLKKVGTSQRIKSSANTYMEDASNQGRMIADLDRDTSNALMDDEGTEKKAKDAQVAGDEQVKGRQAEIYQIDMDHALKVLSMQEDEPEVQEAVDVVTTTKLITKVVAVVSESVTAAKEEKEWLSWIQKRNQLQKYLLNQVQGQGQRNNGRRAQAYKEKATAKEDPYVQRNQVIKKRPQTEAQARRNMIMYLKNTKEQMEEEENRAIEIINETLAQKAAKKRKLNKEVKDLKQHLEIVPDEDDDVYTEATPLARKVHVVDYQIIQLNNKPRYKIIRADGTHQL